MSCSNALRRIALPLVVAFGVLYLYGMRSGVTTIALLGISVAVLYFAMSSMMGSAQATQDALDACEQIHCYSGWNIRVFVDEQGQSWLRATDIKRYLGYDKSNAWLARRYPTRYRKVHPQIEAWYMHPDAVRDFVGKQGNESAQRFLTWINREVLGINRYDRVMATPGISKQPPKTEPNHNPLFTYFVRHWRGETGLMTAIFGGGVLVAGAVLAIKLLKGPVDITLHYRLSALIYVMQLAVVSGGMYWWGRGVLHSTQRWIAADRSLFAALLAAALGFGSVLYGLSNMVDTDKQYFLTDFFTIMLDADNKPDVRYDAIANRVVLNGELGFGTTIRVRKLLLDHPQARSIELKSYGGRVAEGFGLMRLIAENKWETYVRAECMSACVDAYIGGAKRYVASSAKFGLHRAGVYWQAGGDGLSNVDIIFANNLRAIGVDEDFIQRGLKPSLHQIYLPTPEEVLSARLATAEWIQ